MRLLRHHLLPLFFGVFFPAAVLAGGDRGIVEDGTNALTAPNRTTVWGYGQDSTTLVPHTCAANTCTRAAPSAATEGMVITDVANYRVSASLSTGTFSGGGVLQIWVYDIKAASWSYIIGSDLSMTGSSGLSSVSWPTKLNSFKGPQFRVAVRAVAVTTSAAAPTLTVRITGCFKNGCGA